MKFIKKHKKLIIILVIVIAIIGLIASKIGKQKDMTPTINTFELKKGNIEKIVKVKGQVVPEDTAEITSRYNYEVTQIYVKEGDKVTKGQVLASLDPEEMQDDITNLKDDINIGKMRIQETQDNEKDIYKSLENIKLQKEQIENDLSEAKRQVTLKQQLFDGGAIPQEELTQAKLAQEKLEISLQENQETMKKAEFDIQVAERNAKVKNSQKAEVQAKEHMLSQKENKLKKLQITSPIEGTVTRVYAKIGSRASETENNKPMFIIEDQSKKYVKVNVGEYDISTIKEGQSATITSDVLANNESLPGVVDRVLPSAEEKASGSGGVQNIIPVKILVEHNDPRLISGVTAKVDIKTETETNVYVVPFDTVLEDENGKFIYEYKKDGTIKKVPVTIGLDSGVDQEIQGTDLKEGMTIVASPDETLQDGMKVKLEGQEGDTKDKKEDKKETKEENKKEDKDE